MNKSIDLTYGYVNKILFYLLYLNFKFVKSYSFSYIF